MLRWLALLCLTHGAPEAEHRRLRTPVYYADRKQHALPSDTRVWQIDGDVKPTEQMMKDPGFVNAYYKGFSDRRTACTPPPSPRGPLNWLHIAKTGQSFLFTMVRWGCPDVPLQAIAEIEHELAANESSGHRLVVTAQRTLQFREKCDLKKIVRLDP